MQSQDNGRNTRGEGGEWQETRNGRTVWVVSHSIPGQRPKTWRAEKLSDAQAKRNDFRERLARGEVSLAKPNLRQQLAEDERPTVTFGEHVEHWLKHWVKPDYTQGGDGERERGKQPTTYQNYRWIADKYVLPNRLARVKMDDLDLDHIEAFWDEISATRGGKQVGYTMRRKVLVMLRTVVNYVIVHRPRSTRLRFNPVISVLARLRKPTAKPKPSPDADILGAILGATRGTELELLTEIALRFGLRRGNIVGLRFGDFDLAAGTLIVRRRVNRIKGQGLVVRGGLKTQDENYVSQKSISPANIEALGRLLQAQRVHNLELFVAHQATWTGPDPRSEAGYLFATRKGTPRDPSDLLRAFKDAAGTVGHREYNLHRLRHDFVSIGLKSRSLWEMSKAADHANTTVTEEVYGHITSDHLGATFADVGAWIDTNATRKDHAATG